MKSSKPLLIAFSLLCMVTLPVLAQETKPADQKGTAPATTDNKEEPKNEVERMLEQANKRGELVLGACIEDCADDAETSDQKVKVGHVVALPRPSYPPLARAAHIQGEVKVQVFINTEGKVIAAAAISGHPLLRAASVQAARDSVFSPTYWEGKPVNVAGVLVYTFRPE